MTDAFLWRNIVGTLGFIYIFEFKQDGAVRKCLVSDKEKGRILKIGDRPFSFRYIGTNTFGKI